MFELRCVECGALQPPSNADLECADCAGPLEVKVELRPKPNGLAGYVRDDLPGLWRYLPLLPFAAEVAPVTLGEGSTPIVRLDRWGPRNGLAQVYAKLEHLSPTGSFKDRGSAALCTRLRELSVQTAVEDSSGNAGASIAAYCAKAGIHAVIFAPAAAPPAKLAQIENFGAELRRIPGSREDVAAAARARSKETNSHYASHNLHPYFIEGTKTFAYEIYEHFNGAMPRHLIFPVGNGSLFLGMCKGLKELLQIGCRFQAARLHVAQAAACAPIVAAASAGQDDPAAVTPALTLAGGITIAKPIRGRQVLRELRRHQGAAVAVSEREIWDTRLQLAHLEGLCVEPTSAVAFAAAARLRAQGEIAENDSVLIPVTGSGLKDPSPQEPPK